MSANRELDTRWKVGGLPLHLSEQDVVRQKGAPSQYQDTFRMVYDGDHSLITVTLDEERLVHSLWGFSLEGPAIRVFHGDSIDKVQRGLGPPDILKESNLTYYKNGLQIDVGYNPLDGTISTICLRALDKKERALLYAQRGYADW